MSQKTPAPISEISDTVWAGIEKRMKQLEKEKKAKRQMCRCLNPGITPFSRRFCYNCRNALNPA